MSDLLTQTQRKFIGFLLVFAASVVFLVVGKIDQAVWFEVTKWNGGFLAAATAVEKFAKK